MVNIACPLYYKFQFDASFSPLTTNDSTTFSILIQQTYARQIVSFELPAFHPFLFINRNSLPPPLLSVIFPCSILATAEINKTRGRGKIKNFDKNPLTFHFPFCKPNFPREKIRDWKKKTTYLFRRIPVS